MRSYELTASPKQVQRSAGRSSVAAIAYRSGTKIYDERTGIMHDYRNKKGVEHTAIFAPDTAPDWVNDRAKLWNAVEAKENKSNAMTAREWVIGFPAEFNKAQRIEAGESIAREQIKRLSCAVDIAYHEPNTEGDERNYHGHFQYTTRSFDESTQDGWSKTKYRNFSHDKVEVDGKTVIKSSHEILHMREFIAQTMNQIAQRDGLEVQTEHLSYKERGIDKQPTQHIGYYASDMERKGKESERGTVNREIRAANESVYDLEHQKKVITLDYAHQKRALERQAETQKKTLKQIEDNLKSRNKLLGFITGKTKEDQRKAANIRDNLREKIIKDKREERTAQQLRTEDKEAFKKKRHIERANDNRMNEQQRDAHRLAQLKQDPLEPSRDLGTGMANVAGREFEKAVLEDKKTGRQQEQTRARLADQHAKPVIDSRSEEAVNNNRFGGLLTPEQIAENVKMQRELHGAPVERGDYRDGLKPQFREKLERAEENKKAEPVDIETPSEKRSRGHTPDLE